MHPMGLVRKLMFIVKYVYLMKNNRNGVKLYRIIKNLVNSTRIRRNLKEQYTKGFLKFIKN